MEAKDIALIKALGGGGSGGSGGSITVDSALSDTSENPVQNKVIKSALDEKLEAPATGKAPYQELVTDGDGNVKWGDRLAYEYTEWKDFTLSDGEITGFTMPPVGDTVTVKVDGVESVETVKSAEFDGATYSYIGSIDLVGLQSGNNGWCVAHMPGSGMLAVAIPETTVSLLVTEQHKIDEKYIQQDKNFVRPLSYYISGYTLFKTYYNKSGEKILAYKCDSIKHLSNLGEVLIYDGSGVGLCDVGSIKDSAFFVNVYILSPSGINYESHIYGTDETDIAELAASYGYTLTTKPTT